MAARAVGMYATAYVSTWAAIAYRYRPSPDHGSTAEEDRGLAGGSRVAGGGREVAATKIPPPAGHCKARKMDIKDGEPLHVLAMRSSSMAVGMVVSRFVASLMNTTTIVDEGGEHHKAWLHAVRNRADGVALITVANHISVFDDPGLVGAIVPWDTVVNPKQMRWGICTQEICFKNPFLQMVMGSGQALPIRRGAGIKQPLFLDVARHVAAGHWVHVFPEGRVLQSGQLGIDPHTTRSDEEMSGQKGRLKWGVGRLIAHSHKTPTVIPFYHTGMSEVLPDRNEWVPNSVTGELEYDVRPRSLVPRTGNKLSVEFGGEIRVRDLVEAHEKRHGPLKKVSWRPEDLESDWEWWRNEPTREEKLLYSAITKRVEESLLELEKRARERGDGVRDASSPKPK